MLKKIENDEKICVSPEHTPPSHMVYRPGTYEWTCPKCKTKTTFRVNGPIW